MDRINGENTVDIGGGKRGFRSQNKSAGLAGTEMTSGWFNAIQEEILAVIEGAGLDPEQTDWTQLRQAIAWMIANATPDVDLSGYLQKAGGTMTGSLILDHAPEEDMEAVNKGYLDALFGGDTSVALYIVRVFGGSANGLAGSPRPTAPTELVDGDLIIGQLAASNTATAVTIQLGTGTIYTVMVNDGTTAPAVGQLVGGHLVLFRKQGTKVLAIFDFTSGRPLAPITAGSGGRILAALPPGGAAADGYNIASIVGNTITFTTALDTSAYVVMGIPAIGNGGGIGSGYGIGARYISGVSGKSTAGFTLATGDVAATNGSSADAGPPAAIPGFFVIG